MSRAVFLAALAVHVTAGLTAVVAGVLAATAGKRPGRHPRAGRVYLYALVVGAGSAAVMAVLHWPRDIHLLALGTVALLAGWAGYRARRHRGRRWMRWHIAGMGGSYVVLLTAFYVDNGPQLPVWKLLPGWAFWVLPALVGAPLIARALVRYRAVGSVAARRRRSGAPRRWPRPGG